MNNISSIQNHLHTEGALINSRNSNNHHCELSYLIGRLDDLIFIHQKILNQLKMELRTDLFIKLEKKFMN